MQRLVIMKIHINTERYMNNREYFDHVISIKYKSTRILHFFENARYGNMVP